MTEPAAPLRLRLRFKRGGALVLGPGRMDLLEQIDTCGSISAAARAMGMSYRRAWLLVDETNGHFARPLVESVAGGQRGGGARLTAEGRAVLDLYRAMQRKAEAAMTAETAALQALLKTP
ncbi:MAG: LysR family transcriptional regulator [Caenispirillum bisanense]|nr:LysR family transcriptional regulator [Caenispirillum bisanense]MCA1973592.1 LysR family transcriptional regulator [Caenispirillum sp.]